MVAANRMAGTRPAESLLKRSDETPEQKKQDGARAKHEADRPGCYRGPSSCRSRDRKRLGSCISHSFLPSPGVFYGRTLGGAFTCRPNDRCRPMPAATDRRDRLELGIQRSQRILHHLRLRLRRRTFTFQPAYFERRIHNEPASRIAPRHEVLEGARDVIRPRKFLRKDKPIFDSHSGARSELGVVAWAASPISTTRPKTQLSPAKTVSRGRQTIWEERSMPFRMSAKTPP